MNSDEEEDKIIDRRSDDNSDGEQRHHSRLAETSVKRAPPSPQPDGAETDKRIQDSLNMSHEDLSDVSDLESAHASPANGKDHHEDGEEVNQTKLYTIRI